VRGEAERAFLATKGDIRETLRPILQSKEILDGPPILRRPFDFIVAAIRATGAQTDGNAGIQAHLTAMGQPLNQWLMPDGYTESAGAWTGTLLARWNFALALVEGRIPGTKLSDTSRTQQTLAHLSQHPNESLAIALMSPEYQWR